MSVCCPYICIALCMTMKLRFYLKYPLLKFVFSVTFETRRKFSVKDKHCNGKYLNSFISRDLQRLTFECKKMAHIWGKKKETFSLIKCTFNRFWSVYALCMCIKLCTDRVKESSEQMLPSANWWSILNSTQQHSIVKIFAVTLHFLCVGKKCYDLKRKRWWSQND